MYLEVQQPVGVSDDIEVPVTEDFPLPPRPTDVDVNQKVA